MIRLGKQPNAIFKATIDVTSIIQFFKYRQGPKFETFIASIHLTIKQKRDINKEFKNCSFNLDNHISWLQKNGLLYVYTDGRLNIGTPRIGTLMFEQENIEKQDIYIPSFEIEA